MFPWGNEPIGSRRANIASDADGCARLAPGGSFRAEATPESVLDMFGNAGEWCLDWFAKYAPGDQADPRGPTRGEQRVAHGSAHALSADEWPVAATRGCGPPDARMDTIGLRVVREFSEEEKMFERLSRDE